MPYLQSNIPHFKCWVRREYTKNHEEYHGEFLHAMAIAVTTMPCRCLSFQLIFTGIEAEGEEEDTVHGGAMWARMPITALVGDVPLEEWPEPMPVWAAQPWDCSSHHHSVYVLDRATPCPWLAKIDGEMYPAKYLSPWITQRVRLLTILRNTSRVMCCSCWMRALGQAT